MFSILLAIIYLAFISLGLPDALLGSALHEITREFGIPVSFCGLLYMLISLSTITSTLMSEKLVRFFGTGRVTAFSVMLTAGALIGFSLTKSFYSLCFLSIPYGFGAGAVDSALNNYVAIHYKGRHMNWLHCFWGIGAALGPYIMGSCIGMVDSWRCGYTLVGMIQIFLSLVLLFSLPMWQGKDCNELSAKSDKRLRSIFKIKGVGIFMMLFFCYFAFESTAGLWASSFLLNCKGLNVEMAASLASLFYIGITLGRLLGGFISDLLGDAKMIRIGGMILLLGAVFLILPSKYLAVSLIGIFFLGVGGAPIFPCAMHLTPMIFGKENSSRIISLQMASAYLASTFIPYFFGVVAEYKGMEIYPFFLLSFIVVIVLIIRKTRSLCEVKN